MLRPLQIAVAGALLVASAARGDADPFGVQIIPSSGRTVTAELVDLDGDGRQDLLHAVIHDMPPVERRILRVHLQRPNGTIPAEHDLETAIPAPSAAYDIADVDGVPGAELLILQPRGVAIVSFVRDEAGALVAKRRDALVPEQQTIGAASDERGLDRISIANFGFGPTPWLVVPGVAETFFLSPSGEIRARIESGARANYFIQPPGPMLTESDIQIFLDAPRISVGDVNGDGRPDILASGRHELRLFYQGEGQSYASVPDEAIALRRVTFEDHIRGSGSVRSIARDIDGDGLADLLLSLTVGGLMDSSSNTYVHFNKGSGWDLARPDASFETEKSLSADQLIDLDGDGSLEIVRIGIPISVLELVEIFVQSAMDAWLYAYDLAPASASAESTDEPEPIFKTKFAVPLDFETSRPAGFVPTIAFDVNGDGFNDYLSSHDGTRFEVFLGSEKGFRKKASQKLSTEGQIRAGDLDADGLPDFVLFNTRRMDEPVRIVTNRGTLPDSPKRVSIEPAED